MESSDQDTSSSSPTAEPAVMPDHNIEEVKTCPSQTIPKSISPDFIMSGSITIVVGFGTDAKEFTCHKKLLGTYSDYFQNVLDSDNCIGTQTDTHKLPSEDPVTFAVIIQWLYNKTIVVPAAKASEMRISLIRVWCLAEKLGMQDCQNAVMDTIHSSLGGSIKEKVAVGVKAMKLINDLALPEDNILRIFFIQRFAYEMVEMKRKHCRWNGTLKGAYVQFFKVCPSLVPDVMIEWYSLSLRDDRTDPAGHTDICAYHVHVKPVIPLVTVSESPVTEIVEEPVEQNKETGVNEGINEVTIEVNEQASKIVTTGDADNTTEYVVVKVEDIDEAELSIQADNPKIPEVDGVEASSETKSATPVKTKAKKLAQSDAFWEWDRVIRSSQFCKSSSPTSTPSRKSTEEPVDSGTGTDIGTSACFTKSKGVW